MKRSAMNIVLFRVAFAATALLAACALSAQDLKTSKRSSQAVSGEASVVPPATRSPDLNHHDIAIMLNWRFYTGWLSGGPFSYLTTQGSSPLTPEMDQEDGQLLSHIRDAYNDGYAKGAKRGQKLHHCEPVPGTDPFFNAFFRDGMQGSVTTVYGEKPDMFHSLGLAHVSPQVLRRWTQDVDDTTVARSSQSFALSQVTVVGEMAGLVATHPCATDAQLQAFAGHELANIDHRFVKHIQAPR